MTYNERRGERRIMKADSVEDILRQPDYDNRPNHIIRMESIMKFLEESDGVTTMQLSREFKTPEATIRRDLQRLLDNRMIWREKCKCGQGWIYQLNK